MERVFQRYFKLISYHSSTGSTCEIQFGEENISAPALIVSCGRLSLAERLNAYAVTFANRLTPCEFRASTGLQSFLSYSNCKLSGR